MAGGAGPVHDYRDHRRASPCQSQWSSYPGAGPPLTGDMAMAEGFGGQYGASLLGGGGDNESSGADKDGEGGGQSAPPPGWRVPSTDQTSYQQLHPSMSARTRATRMRHPAGGGGVAGIDDLPATWKVDVGIGYLHDTFSAGGGGGGRHRETRSLPSTLAPLQGGEYGRATLSPSMDGRGAAGIDATLPSLGVRDPHRQSHAAAVERALAMARLSPPPSWDLESGGRSGVAARPSQVGGGLASFGLGGNQCSGTGNRTGGPGAYTDFDYDLELCHDDQLQGGSPVRDQHHRQSSQPQSHQQQDHDSQLTSVFSSAGTAVAPSRFGRGGSDLRPYSAGLRPRFQGVAGSARPSYSFPELVEAVAAVGDQAAGGPTTFTFGELQGDSGCYVGGAGEGAVGGAIGAGAAEEGGSTEQQRWGAAICFDQVFTFPACLLGCLAWLLSVDVHVQLLYQTYVCPSRQMHLPSNKACAYCCTSSAFPVSYGGQNA